MQGWLFKSHNDESNIPKHFPTLLKTMVPFQKPVWAQKCLKTMIISVNGLHLIDFCVAFLRFLQDRVGGEGLLLVDVGFLPVSSFVAPAGELIDRLDN